MTLSRIFSQAGLIMIFRLAGAGIIFFLQAAIARFWGQSELGLYLLAFSVANLCAVIMPLGFQTIASYFVAEYGARSEGQSLRHFVKQSLLQIALMFFTLAVVGKLLFARFIGQTQEWLTYWPQIIIIALATACIFMSGSVLVALKRPVVGNIADTLIKPILIAVSFFVAWRFSEPESGLWWMLCIMAAMLVLLALVHGSFAMRSAFNVSTTKAHQQQEVSRWWHFALPWTIIALGTDYFFDIDLIALSTHLPHEKLAIFGVVTRIFMLAAFGVSAAYAISLPDIFAIDAQKEPTKFLNIIRVTNLNAFGLAVFFFIGIVMVGPFIFHIFGKDFAVGFWPLVTVFLGLVLRTAFGPAALVLSIYNDPYAALPAVGLGIAALLIGNAVLVPSFGLVGASFSAVLAIALWSASLWLTCKKRTGLDVSILSGRVNWPKL